MKFCPFVLLGIIGGIAIFFVIPGRPLNAQSLVPIASDFARPAVVVQEKARTASRKPTYRLKRTTSTARLRSPAAATPRPSNETDLGPNEEWAQIGVTFWRLENDADTSPDSEAARLLVREAGESRAYAPQRVTASTVFKLGDKVRLSFESPSVGYLYVVDREIYADGTFGEPYLIFPTMSSRGGDNRVRPGVVTDIPSQSDRVPYFTLRSDNQNWRGEMLTVVVSAEPLSGMGMPDKPTPVSPALIGALETKYLRSASEYEQEGSAGKSYTKAEKEAGGDNKRQLTQDDPFPQTVYRVKTHPKEPLLINFNLSVK